MRVRVSERVRVGVRVSESEGGCVSECGVSECECESECESESVRG